jgi:chromosome segregation ATPase
MNDQGKKEDSWVRKLPIIIVALAVLTFMIVVITDHNQYKKWKAEQSDLTGKVKQTDAELEHLKEASGALQDVTKKVETQKQQVASMTVALEKLIEEKNTTDAALSRLRQEMSQANQQFKDLSEQVSAGKNKVAELTKETDTLQRTLALRNKDIEKTNEKVKAARSQQEMLLETVQRLEGEIVNKKSVLGSIRSQQEMLLETVQRLEDDIENKKSVLGSIEFLQRQKPLLEQEIQDLKTRNDLVEKVGFEQQAMLDTLQNKIKEGAAALQAQNERRTALSKELAELTDAVKKLSSQKENLAMLGDHQKELEYLENLQRQKESMEIAIDSLLQKGKILELNILKLQQSGATR